ncbi:MAG: hypothetical protein ACC633_06355 [Anaerolineales bacterium]
MRGFIERIEYNWWNLHIKVMDESQLVRDTLPKIKEAWEMRQEAVPYLAWSLVGFPLGIVLGLLTVIVK